MSMVMLIICLVSGVLSFISFLFNRRKPTKKRRRITYVLSVILLFAAITSGALSYWLSLETEEQLQLAHTQASEASEQANRAQAQITKIRTPRRMEPENQAHVSRKTEAVCGTEVRHEGIQRPGFPGTGTGYPSHFGRSRLGVHECVPETCNTLRGDTRRGCVYNIGQGRNKKDLRNQDGSAWRTDPSRSVRRLERSYSRELRREYRANPRRHQNHANPLLGLANPVYGTILHSP